MKKPVKEKENLLQNSIDSTEAQLFEDVGKRLNQFLETQNIQLPQSTELAEEGKPVFGNNEVGVDFSSFTLLNYLCTIYQLNLNWLYTGKGEPLTIPPIGSDTGDSITQELLNLMQIPEVMKSLTAKFIEMKRIYKVEIAAYYSQTDKLEK